LGTIGLREREIQEEIEELESRIRKIIERVKRERVGETKKNDGGMRSAGRKRGRLEES